MATDREKSVIARLEAVRARNMVLKASNSKLTAALTDYEDLKQNLEALKRSIKQAEAMRMEYQAALLQLGAKAHRAKWEFDGDDFECTPHEVFDLLHNLGDLALKYRKEI